MSQPVSISLSKFTASVQAAVKAAITKHPKFKIEVPSAVSVAYLIRGVPVPEAILSNVTVHETQAFATDIAAHIVDAHPEAFATASRVAAEGAILSIGTHLILGIPPHIGTVQIEK
jgi:hypothetical protein